MCIATFNPELAKMYRQSKSSVKRLEKLRNANDDYGVIAYFSLLPLPTMAPPKSFGSAPPKDTIGADVDVVREEHQENLPETQDLSFSLSAPGLSYQRQ